MNNYGFDNLVSYLQNNFKGGEAGDRLSVNKDSEYYLSTANTIINMITTELGTLRVIKDTVVNTVSGATFTEVQQVINTKYNFYIVITKDKIYTLSKDDFSLVNQISDTIQFDRKKVRATLIENFLLVPQTEGTRKDYEINNSGAIGLNANFSESLRLPVKDRNTVKIDVYQVRNLKMSGTTQLRPYKVTTTEQQEFKVVEGKLKFKYDEDLNITRIYYPYQAEMINIENITGLKENDYFISIYPLTTSSTKKFYLGNAELEFTDKQSDVSGTYYTGATITGEIGNTGLISYGTLMTNFSKFYTIAEYQNRMIVSDGEYIYFSKVGDYNYFLNGTLDDDAFFVKLSTVNSEIATIQRILTGRGVWVITDKGVYLLGYNQVIKGNSIDVRFIGADLCTIEACDINNTLYYLTEKTELKAIQNTTGIKGYVDFDTYLVDKFNSTQNINSIDEYVVDNRKFLYASLKQPKTKTYLTIGAYLYKEENINVFSRVSIEAPENAVPYYDILFLDSNNILTRGNNNIEKAYIILNTPPTKTKNYGYLLNDPTSQYKKVAIKFIDDSNEAIRGVTINDIHLNLLGDPQQGVYSIYTSILSCTTLTNKVEVEIETNQNEFNLELQATEVFYVMGEK